MSVRLLMPLGDGILTSSAQYDMLTTSITTNKFRARVLDKASDHLSGRDPAYLIPSLSDEDSDLRPGDETGSIIALTSPWIDLCSPDPIIYEISKQVLELEIAYASFCGIGNIIISGPGRNGEATAPCLTQFAYAIKDALDIGNFYQLQLRLSMREDLEDCNEPRSNRSKGMRETISEQRANMSSKRKGQNGESLADYARSEFIDGHTSSHSKKMDSFATWDTWNIIRSICGYSARLSIALDIPRDLPPAPLQSRWFSEPLRIVFVGGSIFSTNKSGFPALSAGHQALLSHYMRVKQPPWLLLSDADRLSSLDLGRDLHNGGLSGDSSAFPTLAEAKVYPNSHMRYESPDFTLHIDYMRHFQRKQEPLTATEQFSSGYQDYLQSPLQPLADNLESVTYEVFEKDPVKYDQYEKAITAALEDWIRKKKPQHRKDRVVVAVVGAGRGPLVTRALQASEKAQVDIELWAVEKNPNAFVLLQRHQRETWKGRVNLVQSDMRSWKGPHSKGPARHTTYSIDILISELLGSFADNELSPECLDAVTPLLTPKHGVSIPCSYASFLTPIATPKIHSDLSTRSRSDPSAQHMPWVAMLHSFDFLSVRSQVNGSQDLSSRIEQESLPLVLETWSFRHDPPSTGGESHQQPNKRQCHMTFPIRDRAVCHGFAGYFEAELYHGVDLSTNPLTMQDKSPDMTSWFPIFFPLKVIVGIGKFREKSLLTGS